MARRQGPRSAAAAAEAAGERTIVMRSSETKKVIFRYESINLNVFNCAVKSLKITTKSGLTDLSISFLYREGNDGKEK